jgi:hypothetical protein
MAQHRGYARFGDAGRRRADWMMCHQRPRKARSFYDRKKSRTNRALATKAPTHTLDAG